VTASKRQLRLVTVPMCLDLVHRTSTGSADRRFTSSTMWISNSLPASLQQLDVTVVKHSARQLKMNFFRL